jgi:hypothetical protein
MHFREEHSMTKVLIEMSVSLDGYVTGPDVSAEEPMGRGGEQLHDWMFEGRPAAKSEAFQTDRFSNIGAVIIGRRMADLGIGPWGEEPTFHAPVFVITHRPTETIVRGRRIGGAPPAPRARVLGAGTRLFDKGTSPRISLRPTAAVNTPQVTHLTYIVETAAADTP